MIEGLETRRLLAYAVGLSGTEVTFSGDAAVDSLELGVDSTGNLVHNLPLDGNLVSAIDLDSLMPGEQSQTLDEMTGLTVDDPDDNDTLTIAGPVAFHFPRLNRFQASVGEILVSRAVFVEGPGEVSLTAARSVFLASQGHIRTDAGNITITAHAGPAPIAADFTGITLDGAVISSRNGDIELRGAGGDKAGGSLNRGVYLNASALVESTGTGVDAGTITIAGVGGDGGASNRGVQLEGSATAVRSVDGNIRIEGRGGTNSTSVYGQGILLGDGIVESSGEGVDAAEITIDGSGGNGGVFLTSDLVVQSVDGDIRISGMGGEMSAGPNRGVVLHKDAIVKSTGTGLHAAKITIVGTGGNAGDR